MQKLQRLEQDVKLAISKIISEEIKNPSVTGIISVTDVKITKDEKYAKVFISIYGAKSKIKCLNAIKTSSSFIRTSLAKMVKMRCIPELTFEIDDSLEYGAHMDEVFRKLNEDSSNN